MSIYYRPHIQNGQIAKRRFRAVNIVWIRPAMRAISLAPGQERQQSRALLFLIAFGAFIAAGFLFSLHQHFTASAIEREEVQLKSTMDHTFSEQRHLEVKRARALSPREIERAAGERGALAPVKLDPPAVLRPASTSLKRAGSRHDGDGQKAQGDNSAATGR